MSPAIFYTNEGTETLDVFLSGDGVTDAVGAFTLAFGISSDPSNGATPYPTLQFVAPPADPTLDETLNDPNYIFAGNSSDLLGSPPSSFGASSTDNTMLNVGDSTNDFNDVIVGTGTNGNGDLVARLRFTVPAEATSGYKFDITLLNPDTAFQSNNSTGYLPLAGVFSSTITVESPLMATVPEPGTCGMMLAGVIGLALARRKRHAGM